MAVVGRVCVPQEFLVLVVAALCSCVACSMWGCVVAVMVVPQQQRQRLQQEAAVVAGLLWGLQACRHS
jgi:hypothetical protein